MIRLTIFIIALLLAIEALAPTAPWLVTLAVLAGIELLRIGPLRGPRFVRRQLRAFFDEDDW